MPGFSKEVAHPLSQQEAVDKLKQFIDKIHEKYKDQVSGVEGTWNDNVLSFSLTAYSFTISGTLTVVDKLATIEGTLPFAALAFKGKIQDSFASELQKELGSA